MNRLFTYAPAASIVAGMSLATGQVVSKAYHTPCGMVVLTLADGEMLWFNTDTPVFIES